jgi:hypothetical protein
LNTRNGLRIFKTFKFIQNRGEIMASGGRRSGAGRKAGSAWKPAIKAFRADAVEKMHSIVNGDQDPLSVVAAWVVDTSLDINTRLSAAATCLPFLYPKLSASQVDSRITVTKVDTADLIRRLDERIARAHPQPPLVAIEAPIEVTIVADGEVVEA